MLITKECSLSDFDAWSNAVEMKEAIIEQGKEDEFEDLINELYPDGIDEVQLNDILRFEQDWLIETLCLECTHIKVEIFDIDWDIDEDDLSEEELYEIKSSLPEEEDISFENVSESDLEDAISDYLSENYDYCVNSFEYHIVDKYI